MMKNKLYRIVCGILLLSYTSGIMAQSPASHAAPKAIADVLTQLPAEDPATYNRLMKELSETGPENIKILVGLINAPGKGSNAAVSYALSGLTHYASGDEVLKNKVEQAYIAALDETNERETKAFLIRQLAIVGSDAAINKLSGYLTEESLSSPAACAIASIGGEAAAKTLQMALMSRIAITPGVQRNLIQALGDVVPIEGTEALLGTLIQTGDAATKGAVLKTLSQTGSKASLANLAAAAAATGYKPEMTNANDAYLQLIKRVNEQGDTKEAAAAAQSLLKNATKSGATQIRIAALEIVFATQADPLKTLRTALKDNDRAYRNAALAFASDYADKAMYTELLKSLPKAKTDEKTDVLNWIGNEAQCSDKRAVLKTVETGIEKTGTQTLMQLLNDTNFEVKQASAGALGHIGDKDALPALVELFKSSDTQVVALAKSVLSSFDGDVSPHVARVMNQSSHAGKVAALELLAGRKADAYFNAVVEQTNSASSEVRLAAYKALKDVVSEKDFVILCGMLETAEPAFVSPLQQAVISAVAAMSPAKRTETITDRMLQAGDTKKYLYYPVLSSTEDPAALELIVRGISEGSGGSKDAAFEALLSWKGWDAEEALYAICEDSASPYYEKAMNAYITLVSSGKMTGEDRLPFLRKAMDAAKVNEQKNRVLRLIGKTGTYPALLYAGEFMDDAALKESAAQAVVEIALANKDYTGLQVRELLNKAASVLDNPDADYQRQAIRKHLDEMPEDAKN